MAPFSVSAVKEKASIVKNTSSHKFQNYRDKFASRSSSGDTSNRYPKAPVSQPRTSSEVSQSSSTLQPSRPIPPPTRQRGQTDTAHPFQWSLISDEDKGLFFGWLDEFFDTRGRGSGMSNQLKPVVAGTGVSNELAVGGQVGSASEPISSAQEFSKYFSSATRWKEPWYCSEQPTPPPLANTSDGLRMHSLEWRGGSRTLTGGVLFQDLSACWYTVSWTDSNAHDVSLARRSAAFTPRPDALSGDDLIAASEAYGEAVASFAEGYEGSGRWCARGECWDLANEALKAIERSDYVPKPLTSIGTTHGCLIYSGNAWGSNANPEQTGQWRGGDDRIRRGDIVQWKSVKIVDGNRWFTLGEPDHTAIIVREQRPLKAVLGSQALRPADIGSLEVVEQSRHSPPARQVYRLSGMVSGYIWIYRPVSVEGYLKFVFSGTRPEIAQKV